MRPDPAWERGAVSVWWCAGAVYIEVGGAGIVLDASPGSVSVLQPFLGNVREIVLSSGRIGAVGGLVPLLVALEPHRLSDVPLPLHVPLGDERGAMLAESWVMGWQGRYPVTVDAVVPGTTLELGEVLVETIPLRCGEPMWRADGVEGRVGVAIRVRAADATVAWIPGAAPDGRVSTASRGADLAIVEVGVMPWPRTSTAWRLAVDDVLRLCADAADVWIAGDDGRIVGDDA